MPEPSEFAPHADRHGRKWPERRARARPPEGHWRGARPRRGRREGGVAGNEWAGMAGTPFGVLLRSCLLPEVASGTTPPPATFCDPVGSSVRYGDVDETELRTFAPSRLRCDLPRVFRGGRARGRLRKDKERRRKGVGAHRRNQARQPPFRVFCVVCGPSDPGCVPFTASRPSVIPPPAGARTGPSGSTPERGNPRPDADSAPSHPSPSPEAPPCTG
jgi:hypothetical protein